MSHKAKPIRDHYIKSLTINSENLSRQLSAESVPNDELQRIIESICRIYLAETEKIVKECEKDMMRLENVPSPLRLFVDSIAKAIQLAAVVSPAASRLMQLYVSSLEDWM